jgi:hypothetical protein
MDNLELIRFVFWLPGFALSMVVLASAAPEKVVTAFYATYLRPALTGGAPGRDGLVPLVPYLSAGLMEKFRKEGAAEDRYRKYTHDTEPPALEGDLFTSSFEGATGLDAVACTAGAKTARCVASLRFEDKLSTPPDNINRWTDEVVLIATAKGWRIDDIVFGGTWDFMHKGHLRDVLDNATRDLDRAVARGKPPHGAR